MDTGLSTQDFYPDNLNPFGTSDETNLERVTTRDSSCQMGSEIVLKRLVKKLFHQVNELQPNELDDEFIYQSAITYNDYLGLLKYSKDEQLNCASLNKLENILSNFISTAAIRRPMHTNLFSGISLNPFSSARVGGWTVAGNVQASLNGHLLIVLLIVGLVAWFFKNVTGIRSAWKSWPLSFILVGFVQFCIHRNQLSMNHRANLERCKNPSLLARLASIINYDYDNCQTGNRATNISNIALAGVEYLSELIFQPVVHFWEKFGKALEKYLNSFSGFNYLIAPIFPLLIILATILVSVPLLLYLLNKRKPIRQQQRQTNYRAVTITPKKKCRTYAIK